MALVARLQITNSSGGLDDIETLEVRRLTSLHSHHPADEIHRYVTKRYGPDGEERGSATFEHRYGDGAWQCVLRALEALRDRS